MNDVIEKPKLVSDRTDKSSGAWIRAQFQESTSRDGAGDSPSVSLSDEGEESARQELDDSLQQLSATLLRIGEQPAKQLRDEWAQELSKLQSRLSQQTEAVETARNGATLLESALKEVKRDLSERGEKTSGEVSELKVRLDAFEADFGKRLGELSSVLDSFRGEIAEQKKTLDVLRREGAQRTEVAHQVSQVLDSLKMSVNMLGGSEENRPE